MEQIYVVVLLVNSGGNGGIIVENNQGKMTKFCVNREKSIFTNIVSPAFRQPSQKYLEKP